MAKPSPDSSSPMLPSINNQPTAASNTTARKRRFGDDAGSTPYALRMAKKPFTRGRDTDETDTPSPNGSDTPSLYSNLHSKQERLSAMELTGEFGPTTQLHAMRREKAIAEADEAAQALRQG